jgi:hypothetical protein
MAARGGEHDEAVARTLTRWGWWDPATPAEIKVIFSGCRASWWIAGGYAIELAAGRPVRPHADIDVMMLRRDQLAVQQAVAGWDWQAADAPGKLRCWRPAEQLPVGVHDIWCRPGPGQPWRVAIMLDEACGQDWVSRRNPRISRPIASLGRVTADGIPYLAPEIQLFYKAKAARRNDETDFSAVLPMLTGPQRHWLRDAIALAYGQRHPWHARLIT